MLDLKGKIALWQTALIVALALQMFFVADAYAFYKAGVCSVQTTSEGVVKMYSEQEYIANIKAHYPKLAPFQWYAGWFVGKIWMFSGFLRTPVTERGWEPEFAYQYGHALQYAFWATVLGVISILRLSRLKVALMEAHGRGELLSGQTLENYLPLRHRNVKPLLILEAGMLLGCITQHPAFCLVIASVIFIGWEQLMRQQNNEIQPVTVGDGYDHFQLFHPKKLSPWQQMHRDTGAQPTNFIGKVIRFLGFW